MRTIKKRLALCHIALTIGLAAIAIPVEADIDSTAKAVANERHEDPGQTATVNEAGEIKHSKANKVAVFRGVTPPQDDYYDLRREHWEDRLEGRLEYREEYLEGQTGADDDEDAKDSKAGKEDDDSGDKEQDIYEQRREYWRQRLDKEW